MLVNNKEQRGQGWQVRILAKAKLRFIYVDKTEKFRFWKEWRAGTGVSLMSPHIMSGNDSGHPALSLVFLPLLPAPFEELEYLRPSSSCPWVILELLRSCNFVWVALSTRAVASLSHWALVSNGWKRQGIHLWQIKKTLGGHCTVKRHHIVTLPIGSAIRSTNSWGLVASPLLRCYRSQNNVLFCFWWLLVLDRVAVLDNYDEQLWQWWMVTRVKLMITMSMEHHGAERRWELTRVRKPKVEHGIGGMAGPDGQKTTV